MRRAHLAATLALLALAAPPALRAQATGAVRILATEPTVIPLVRGPGHLRTVRVRVGGDTADYLFDTGGGITVVAPQDTAAIRCVPGGKGFGVRLTGEALSGRLCADVTLGVGPLEVADDAGVMDLAKMLGPRAPAVRGQIALPTFRGRAITLDLAHDRLVLETPRSLAQRVRTMTPVEVRLATGEGGGHLAAFVGVRAQNGARLWLEWDSGHGASTFLAPHAVALLGGDSAARALDLRLPLARGVEVLAPVTVKRDMIYDGVLSARLLERAVWTLDLERGRMWMGAVAPILELPPAAARVVPPASDPTGVYETTVAVQNGEQREILEITRAAGGLTGRVRAVGGDVTTPLADVVMQGNELSYRLMLPNPVPVRVTFDGVAGDGRWGDSTRSGAVHIVKRR